MFAKKLAFCLLASFLAILGVTCAPVDSPGTKDESASTAPTEKTRTEETKSIPSYALTGLRPRIEAAIDQVRRRDVLTTNGFWTVFHAILGMGPGTKLRYPDSDERVNALDYICSGGEVRGMRFIQTKHGLDVQTGPLFIGQGHQDQYVAEMAQWGIAADRKFVVEGKDYTYMDFVRHTQMRASVTAPANKDNPNELSWAIIVIGQYLGTDVAPWTNELGEKLTFEDIVRYELNATVVDAACGGTHRLFGLSWVYHLHLAKGGKTTGVWQEVADKTKLFRDFARKYQNPDGSFSTEFFKSPGNDDNPDRRINTTGHILEWLSLALTDAELKEQWVQDAANRLALMILEQSSQSVDGGSLYHAVHGLLLYYARVYDRETLGPRELLIPLPPR
jgi:hypothetical protein